jgi:hexosaminidase
MKNNQRIFNFWASFICTWLCAVAPNYAQYAIIPQPMSMVPEKGFFVLNEKTEIHYYSSNSPQMATFLQNELQKRYGLKLKVKKGGKMLAKNAIILLTGEEDTLWENEAYQIHVKPQHILIESEGNKGRFYAVQTMLQMLGPGKNVFFQLPCVRIEDKPRFGYRGMHLDVSRHFYTVDQVKQYLDYLAMYKFNYFHWHLTDDQGWRIEIKQYPKLTQVGSKRMGTQIKYDNASGKHDGKPINGYYTQEEVREVVRYAQERYITIVPEIEMPGHSIAALAAYPELGCTGSGYEVACFFGVIDDILCGGKAETYTFLKNVLNEVADLFPGPYIHIGGDEAPKKRWKNCEHCQKKIQQHQLKNEEELQRFLIAEMAAHLEKKGKTIIGWDEILEGGLIKDAIIMSWRGEKGGIEAATKQHFAIMTPASHCYFDYRQKQKEDSLTIGGGTISWQKVYEYEPIPPSLPLAAHPFILGAQANVWTEYIPNFSKLQYQIFPRMQALSEVLWSPAESKNMDGFSARLQKHLRMFDFLGINYCKVD